MSQFSVPRLQISKALEREVFVEKAIKCVVATTFTEVECVHQSMSCQSKAIVVPVGLSFYRYFSSLDQKLLSYKAIVQVLLQAFITSDSDLSGFSKPTSTLNGFHFSVTGSLFDKFSKAHFNVILG